MLYKWQIFSIMSEHYHNWAKKKSTNKEKNNPRNLPLMQNVSLFYCNSDINRMFSECFTPNAGGKKAKQTNKHRNNRKGSTKAWMQQTGSEDKEQS